MRIMWPFLCPVGVVEGVADKLGSNAKPSSFLTVLGHQSQHAGAPDLLNHSKTGFQQHAESPGCAGMCGTELFRKLCISV